MSITNNLKQFMGRREEPTQAPREGAPYRMSVKEALAVGFFHAHDLRPVEERTPRLVVELIDLQRSRQEQDAAAWREAIASLDPARRKQLQDVTRELSEARATLAAIDAEMTSRQSERPSFLQNVGQWVKRGGELEAQRAHILGLVTALEAQQADLLADAHDALYAYAQQRVKRAVQTDAEAKERAAQLIDQARDTRRAGTAQLATAQRLLSRLQQGSGALADSFPVDGT